MQAVLRSWTTLSKYHSTSKAFHLWGVCMCSTTYAKTTRVKTRCFSSISSKAALKLWSATFKPCNLQQWISISSRIHLLQRNSKGQSFILWHQVSPYSKIWYSNYHHGYTNDSQVKRCRASSNTRQTTATDHPRSYHQMPRVRTVKSYDVGAIRESPLLKTAEI